MYYLVTAFDQEFAEFAPGKLLVRRLIEYSFDEHLGVFDFCLGRRVLQVLLDSR